MIRNCLESKNDYRIDPIKTKLQYHAFENKIAKLAFIEILLEGLRSCLRSYIIADHVTTFVRSYGIDRFLNVIFRPIRFRFPYSLNIEEALLFFPKVLLETGALCYLSF